MLALVYRAVRTSGVSGRVCRARLTTDGRESGDTLGLLANAVQHVDGGDIADVVGNFELSVSTGALGVDDALWDTLAVKV